MHPSSAVPKTYTVKVRGQPDTQTLARLSHGIAIDGRRTGPVQVRVQRPGHNAWLEVVVFEGRKHLVRRLLQAVGHPVSKLRRIGYGGLRLGRLAAGQVRTLTAEEVSRLRRAASPTVRGRGGHPA
jgi:23S rRNA pseudouridine2605 synthase